MYELEAGIQTTRDVIAQSQDLDDILLHFGTKGMKWGVRKQPGSSTRESRRAEKVGKLDAKAEGYRNAAAGLRSTTAEGKFKNHMLNSKIKNLDKKEQQAVKDSKAKSEGRLTRREKQLLIGGAIVATYAAYSIASAAQSGELNRLAMKGESFLKKNGTPSFKKNSDFAKEFTDPDLLHKSVANGINDHGAIGGKVNCRRSTMAYEMRRRGNDVVATRTTTGKGQTSSGLHNALNNNAKSKDFVGDGGISKAKAYLKENIQKDIGKRTDTPFTDFSERVKDSKGLGENIIQTGDISHGVFRDLGKQPDKARGELSLRWKGGAGGHSVAWEIVGGKPVIFDTQTGEMFKDVSQFTKYGNNVDMAAFTRLDNKPLNEDFLMRWVKNAK